VQHKVFSLKPRRSIKKKYKCTVLHQKRVWKLPTAAIKAAFWNGNSWIMTFDDVNWNCYIYPSWSFGLNEKTCLSNIKTPYLNHHIVSYELYELVKIYNYSFFFYLGLWFGDISVVHALQLTLQKTRRQWFNCRRKAERSGGMLCSRTVSRASDSKRLKPD